MGTKMTNDQVEIGDVSISDKSTQPDWRWLHFSTPSGDCESGADLNEADVEKLRDHLTLWLKAGARRKRNVDAPILESVDNNEICDAKCPAADCGKWTFSFWVSEDDIKDGKLDNSCQHCGQRFHL